MKNNILDSEMSIKSPSYSLGQLFLFTKDFVERFHKNTIHIFWSGSGQFDRMNFSIDMNLSLF